MITSDMSQQNKKEVSGSDNSPPVWFTNVSTENTQRSGEATQNYMKPCEPEFTSSQLDSGFVSGRGFMDDMDKIFVDDDDEGDGPPLAPASPEMEQEYSLDMVCARRDSHRRELCEKLPTDQKIKGRNASIMSFESWSDLQFGSKERDRLHTNTNCDNTRGETDSFIEMRDGRESYSESRARSSENQTEGQRNLKSNQKPVRYDRVSSFSSWSEATNATINANATDFAEKSPTNGADNGAKSKLNFKDRIIATFSGSPKRSPNPKTLPPAMTQSMYEKDSVRNVRDSSSHDLHIRGHSGGKFFTIPLNANGLQLQTDFGQVDQSEKLKTKMMSMWNNMKYGWTVKTQASFSDDKPLFLLGQCYHRKIDESESDTKRPTSVEQFKQDFISKIWFTYRREFPVLAGSAFTTDCGWGCMLRSGQMMLAQALVLHFLGRQWRWHSPQTLEQEAYHRQIVRWCGDFPSDHSPFSVHRLVRFGEKCLNKKPGDWYGPSSVAHIMKEAIEHGCELNPLLGKICLYIAQDCTVYIQDVIDLCTSRPRSYSRSDASLDSSTEESASAEDSWRAVIILIPIRLGGEVLNPIYIPCVQNLFALDNCIGIIGGRPKHSLYFVGWQGDKLIHLDPHYCQDVVEMKEREFPLHTYHCISPRKMTFNRMDPSCTVGFYCRTREDFYTFIKATKLIVAPPMQRNSYPMFIFVDGRSADEDPSHHFDKEERYVRVRHVDEFGRLRHPSHSSEEFVFL